MKRLLLLFFVAFATLSCDMSNDTDVHFEVLPIESFDVPDTFRLGETYPIKVFYRKPTTCYGFDGFYYHKDLNVRTVAVQNFVVNRNDCLPTPSDAPLSEASFNFMVTNNGSYIFRFFKGQDNEGNNIFEEVEIPVDED